MKNKKVNMTFCIAPLIFATLILASCGKERPSSTSKKENEVVVSRPSVSIAFLDDQSSSRKNFGIPPLKVENLEPAIQYVMNYGGALMLGVIAANSDYTTIQFRVDHSKAPARPSKPDGANFTNKFRLYQAEDHYKKQLLPRYKKDSLEYVQTISKKVEKFREDAKQLLSADKNREKTDIVNAINRSLHFHQTAQGASKHYTILISDGIASSNGQITNLDQLSVEYYCAYASSNARGNWIEVCKPIMTPDLTTALELINIY